jgi:hypothetical protein
MKTIAKWYPKEEDVDYGDKRIQDAAKEVGTMPALISYDAAVVRHSRFKLSEKGKAKADRIEKFLSRFGAQGIKFSYDGKLGCSCGCSPGIRVKARVPANTKAEIWSADSDFTKEANEVHELALKFRLTREFDDKYCSKVEVILL